MGDVAKKVMGDVPISYIEGVGGTRVSEDEIVEVGKYDVCALSIVLLSIANNTRLGPLVQTWPIDMSPESCTGNVTGNE